VDAHRAAAFRTSICLVLPRRRLDNADVLGEPHGTPNGKQRGYSARDSEGNLWTFGIWRPDR
jgi:hypothetical protein